MKNWFKKALSKNSTYILLFIILSIHLIFNLSFEKTSIYSGSETQFEGVVSKKTISINKMTFSIDSEEDLVCSYYSEDEDEKNELWSKIKLGSEVQITGSLNEPYNNTIPNTFNYKEYLYNKGIFYTCTIESIVVMSEPDNIFYVVKNFVVDRIMTFKNKDYLYTMIIGDKSLMDEETMDKYKVNGVTHLFAISGMHIGLFAAIITNVLKKCKMKESKTRVVVTMFIWFYAFLAGFGASVVRAGMLFSFLTIDKILELNVSKLKILLLVGFTLIMFDYRIVMDIGFIYSFVTTFGLIYANKMIAKHKILGTSLVANMFSLPITINNFYKFNMMSVIFNVVFVPFVSVVVYPLCLLTFFIRWLEPVTSLAIWMLEVLNDWCASIEIMRFVVPIMPIYVLILYYTVLLVFIKHSLYKVSCILFVVVLLNKLQPVLDTSGYVEFLDVGQGDSILIRSPGNEEVIMVDTGGKVGSKSNYLVSDNTITYLNSLGIERIDYLILTHGDADHLGEADNILENMDVGCIILNRGELNSAERKLVNSGVRVSHEYDGNMKLRFLNDREWGDENSNSIVIHLKMRNLEFLFMGDATKEVEDYIVDKYQIKASIVKLGHHGSKTSSGESFLRSVGAKIGIISSGRKNRYNHPSKETIETLDKLKIEYYNTQSDGSIIYELKRQGVTIFTYPP